MIFYSTRVLYYLILYTMSNIIDAVQVFESSFIIHVLALSAHNFQWVRFEEQSA